MLARTYLNQCRTHGTSLSKIQSRGRFLASGGSPRVTKTFETEAEAKKFAREQLDKGIAVTAGTINPQFPKRLVPSSEISDWLEGDRK